MVLDKEIIGVTGGSGLLGRHVIYFFLKKNYKILTLSRKNPRIKHKNLDWIKIDLSNKLSYQKLDKIFKKLKCLIHIAAFVPDGKNSRKKRDINKINIHSSVNLAKWSKINNKHFIYISGAVIYSNQNKKNSEKSKLKNKSNNSYINSKILSEKAIFKLKDKNFKLTILRPTSIYGYGMKPNKIVSLLIDKIKKNQDVQIFNYLNTRVNFIHAADIATGIFKSFNYKSYGIFNLGQKNCVHFYDIASVVKKLINSRSKILLKRDKKFSKILNPMNVKITLARKRLSWRPKISLKKGLKMQMNRKCI
tara:strand:+ start:42 stop:959 length:918 start_codon:yes stop_codon:yes gene_type:complete